MSEGMYSDFQSTGKKPLSDDAKIKLAETFLEKIASVRTILFDLCTEYADIDAWFDVDELEDAITIVVEANTECDLELARFKYRVQRNQEND